MNDIVNISLWINIVSLALSVWLMARSFRRNNLIAAVYWFIFIFLVVGQAIHISIALAHFGKARYLFNFITPQGHILASIALLYIVLLTGILSHRSGSNWKTARALPQKRKATAKIRGIYYISLFVLFLLISFLVVMLVGGVNTWLFTGRPMAAGATFFILAYGFVIFPLLIKLASGIKTNFLDGLFYLGGLAMVFSFSRITALFFILILVIIFVYSRYENKSFAKSKWALVIFGGLFMLIFFAYGTYRNMASSTNANFSTIINVVMNKPEASLFSLDLNYRISVEGMSGFSAAMSEFADSPSIKGNLGISLIGSIFQFIPAGVRSVFDGFIDYARASYWHVGSVVPSGLENMFVYFSFFGILIYPFIFYLFAYGTHDRILRIVSRPSNNKINTSLLFFAIISAFGLQVIRGSLDFLVQFIIAELIIMYLSALLYKLFYKIE